MSVFPADHLVHIAAVIAIYLAILVVQNVFSPHSGPSICCNASNLALGAWLKPKPGVHVEFILHHKWIKTVKLTITNRKTIKGPSLHFRSPY